MKTNVCVVIAGIIVFLKVWNAVIVTVTDVRVNVRVIIIIVVVVRAGIIVCNERRRHIISIVGGARGHQDTSETEKVTDRRRNIPRGSRVRRVS
jgi:tetrahydromethanopterin S-methyltransferase subunit E